MLNDCVIYFFGRPPFHQGGDHQNWLTKIWTQKGRVDAKRFLTCISIGRSMFWNLEAECGRTKILSITKVGKGADVMCSLLLLT